MSTPLESSQNSETAHANANPHFVLIATDNLEVAVNVAKQLHKIGHHTKLALFDGEDLDELPSTQPSAALFVFSDYIEHLNRLTQKVRDTYPNSNLPIIAAINRIGDLKNNTFDSVLFPPVHPSQISTRVNSMIRLQEMEREIELRTQTLSQDFDITHSLSEADLAKPYRILFIGEASPEFMVIINALQKRNVEVVAAFTSFSAFDFLHESSFDAVVMNALKGAEPALTIASTMLRNSKLYHVPSLLLVNDETFEYKEKAFESGVKDIIPHNSDEIEIAGRIMELANYHRIHSQLKTEFNLIGGEACSDIASGTFNANFFEKHMARICNYYKNTDTPISLIAVRTFKNLDVPLPVDKIARANAQIGGMIKNLVRMQDIVARIEDDLFFIAIPGMPSKLINSVIERISGVVDCAAFETGQQDPKSFTMQITTASTELQNDDTYQEFIVRLYQNLGDLSETRQSTPLALNTN